MSTVDPTVELTELDAPADSSGPETSGLGLRDSMFHGSFHLMLATVLTGGLGYLFWTLAARGYQTATVGLAASAVATATAISLAVHLGPAALLTERLPAHEGTEGWGRRVWTAVLGTAVLSGLLAAAALLVAGQHAALGGPERSGWGSVALIVGCAFWSAISVLGYAFFGARRAGQTSLMNGTISLFKLLLLAGLLVAAVGGVDALIGAWALSAGIGCLLAIGWQAGRAGLPLGRPRLIRPSAATYRSALGHHLTSVGGVLTPYLLPPLVAALLSATDDAYFYLTWLLGGLFFMISPAVASAVFAEGVRDPTALEGMMRRAVRIIGVLLAGPVLIVAVGGHWILGIFGADYARHGYLLLILLLVSTIPDAITNLAVGAFRVTGQLTRSTALNLGMAALTIGGTVLLAPRFGVAGVGLAWLLAQLAGTVWVLPALRRLARATAGDDRPESVCASSS